MSGTRDLLWDSGHLRLEREEARRLMEEGGAPSPQSSDDPLISLKDLDLRFGDHIVLDGISLDVWSGETVCILGGSGAGKSTILRLILGLIKPNGGQILVRGRDVATASREELLELRKDMGMVFQEAALFDSLTVYDNVAFYLHEHEDLPEEEVARRVDESLRMVDLDPEQVEDLLPAELSGGMKKRVGIARALIHQPSILLYDEPTSGLDPITTRTIDDLVLKLQRELGVTSVVVTHDIRSAFRIGNRVALLFGGEIVFQGTPEEMMESGDGYVREFLH
ncbi:MAG: ABC transporter ATP-binding protein [marine benthic group bacterium]|jgi:phospholipid/cholesterol/gamma-HCH transport system ATP-binding protein|nr:ABC transporter ATP-binding protein [Gemmatimonadota bacterium]MCL7936716.1 ABC transporter ATP-binding protein [Gemmatimonadota bacterium]MCL7975852.1 ABC transporter ATP-binding protein [Gemmatimonadota bacterium]MCL7980116.1 ABC transporter ATP-binding protein [Gemmatimonadota bacterium]